MAIERPGSILWFGLGRFGRPMAEHLLRSGYDLVLPATPHAAGATSELLQQGARRLGDGEMVEVCGLSLPTPEDVDEALGPDIACLTRSAVDFSTGHPRAAQVTAERLASTGVMYFDAPVSGSRTAAGTGGLTIWVGAAAESVPSPVAAVISTLAARTFYMGTIGQGAAMKLVNQVTHILTMAAIGEGLQLARANGIDLQTAVASMTTSSADSAMLRRFGPSLAEDDFTAQFALALADKDIRFCLNAAQHAGLQLPHLVQLASDLHERRRLGFSDWNFTAAAIPLKRLEEIRRLLEG